MRRGSTAVALFALGSFSASPSNAQVKPEKNRAMWIWHSSDIINNVNGARSALFNMCAAPPGSQSPYAIEGSVRSINVLYLYAHSFVNGTSTQKANLRSLLSDAHARGIKVEFLDGASDWATTGKAYGEQYVDYAIQFNAAGATAAERFDGIQLDVEPYLLAGWFNQATWDSFMGLLNDCEAKAQAAGLPLGAAIPRWYDSNPGTSYLRQVQAAVDYVAIMDYVDNTASMINDVKTEMQNAKELGKRVVVGFETMVLTPTSTTFNEEGWGNMEGRIYDLNKYYQNESVFDGVAIHHLPTYSTLTQWGTGGADLTAPVIADYSYIPTGTGGYFNVHVVDVCGSTIDSLGSVTTARVTNPVTHADIAGTWAAGTSGYVTFTPTVAVDAGGDFVLALNPKDASGNSRTDTARMQVVQRVSMLSPASGATGIVSNPTLTWSPSVYAQSYRVQVSTDSTFNSGIIYDKAGLTTTSTALSALTTGTKYFWRVSATNGISTSRYSVMRGFTVGTSDVVASTGPIPLPKNKKRS
jgi:hypothetical protein